MWYIGSQLRQPEHRQAAWSYRGHGITFRHCIAPVNVQRVVYWSNAVAGVCAYGRTEDYAINIKSTE